MRELFSLSPTCRQGVLSRTLLPGALEVCPETIVHTHSVGSVPSLVPFSLLALPCQLGP